MGGRGVLEDGANGMADGVEAEARRQAEAGLYSVEKMPQYEQCFQGLC